MPPFVNDCELSGLYGSSLDDDGVDFSSRTQPSSPIPLIGVQVNVQTLDFIAQVQISQSYHNDSYEEALEAVYHFPIYDGAAVCGFEAEYEDGRKVKGIIKEKQIAKQEYNQAMQQGKQANLLESVRRDIFTLKVGNIPPDGFIKINITYVTTLEARDDSIALVLPTSIAPRYTPPSSSASRSMLHSSDYHHHHHHHSQQALAPPTTPIQWYGLDIQVYVKCRSNIESITCPTHNDVDLVTTVGKTGHISLNDIPMDRDVIIKINESMAHQPRACIEMSEEDGSKTSMTGFVTFYPDLEFPNQNNREFIFIVDQSGSMMGLKIQQAKETLSLFLRSLPCTCKFNIIGFGSTYRMLFPTPQPYNDDTLEKATRYVSAMQADLGGTEIVAPLKDAFRGGRTTSVWKEMHDEYSGRKYYFNGINGETSWEKPPFSPPMMIERQVFILTDGQVSNDKQVFDLINQNCKNTRMMESSRTRLFSVGIGDSVSRHLVSGMARAGRGTARFVEEEDHGGVASRSSSDALRVKVLGQLKQALQPSLDDVSIEWRFPNKQKQPIKSLITPPPQPPVKTLLGYRSPNVVDDATHDAKQHPKPKMYPSENPPIFSKHKYLSFAMFPKNCSIKPVGVTVKCMTMDGPLVLDLDITEDEFFYGSIARKLAARTAISEFEDSRKGNNSRPRCHIPKHLIKTPSSQMLSENEASQLALENNLASEMTSFLAVSEDQVVNRWTSRRTQVVPNQQAKKTPAQSHPHTPRYGNHSAAAPFYPAGITHTRNGLHHFSSFCGSYDGGVSRVARYGDGFVSGASHPDLMNRYQVAPGSSAQSRMAYGPPPAPSNGHPPPPTTTTYSGRDVLRQSVFHKRSSFVTTQAGRGSSGSCKRQTDGPMFCAMNMSMPPPHVASSAPSRPAQAFSPPPPPGAQMLAGCMFAPPPPPSGRQMPAAAMFSPPPPPSVSRFHSPPPTMHSTCPARGPVFRPPAPRSMPPPPSSKQFVGAIPCAAPVAPASAAPKVLAKGGMKLGMGSAGKAECHMAAMAADDNLFPIAGVAPNPPHVLSAPPPPSRDQRLNMEIARKQQNVNRVWDDVDHRWVEKGASKAVGIKLDETAAMGKSAEVQAAVSDRVNEMREYKQKAVQERRELEAKKRCEMEELEAFRPQLEPKVKEWSEEDGQKKQLRSLLATLHIVLWSGAKWKILDTGDISEDGKVKRAFHKATLVVHPDKTHHLPADHRYLAKRIFDILCQAKAEFDGSLGVRAVGKNANISTGIASDGKETVVAGDKMLKICMLQRANGSFELDDNLSRAVGVSKSTMDAMINRLGSPAPAVFATALAVAVLRVEFAKKRNVWELQEEKSLAFLASASGSPELLSRMEAEIRALSI